MFDNVSFNPGYAGMNNNICGTILVVSSGLGFEGANNWYIVCMHQLKWLEENKVNLLNDQLGLKK